MWCLGQNRISSLLRKQNRAEATQAARGPWSRCPALGPLAVQSASAADCPPSPVCTSLWLGSQSSRFWVSWDSPLSAKPLCGFAPSLLPFPPCKRQRVQRLRGGNPCVHLKPGNIHRPTWSWPWLADQLFRCSFIQQTFSQLLLPCVLQLLLYPCKGSPQLWVLFHCPFSFPTCEDPAFATLSLNPSGLCFCSWRFSVSSSCSKHTGYSINTCLRTCNSYGTDQGNKAREVNDLPKIAKQFTTDPQKSSFPPYFHDQFPLYHATSVNTKIRQCRLFQSAKRSELI